MVALSLAGCEMVGRWKTLDVGGVVMVVMVA
jgi:hypothetical protein